MPLCLPWTGGKVSDVVCSPGSQLTGDPGDFISFYGTSKHRTPGFEIEHGQTVLWGDPADGRPGQLAQLANYAAHSFCNALFVKVDRSLHRPDGSYTIALIAWTQIQSGDEICAYYGYDPSAGNV